MESPSPLLYRARELEAIAREAREEADAAWDTYHMARWAYLTPLEGLAGGTPRTDPPIPGEVRP